MNEKELKIIRFVINNALFEIENALDSDVKNFNNINESEEDDYKNFNKIKLLFKSKSTKKIQALQIEISQLMNEFSNNFSESTKIISLIFQNFLKIKLSHSNIYALISKYINNDQNDSDSNEKISHLYNMINDCEELKRAFYLDFELRKLRRKLNKIAFIVETLDSGFKSNLNADRYDRDLFIKRTRLLLKGNLEKSVNDIKSKRRTIINWSVKPPYLGVGYKRHCSSGFDKKL